MAYVGPSADHIILVYSPTYNNHSPNPRRKYAYPPKHSYKLATFYKSKLANASRSSAERRHHEKVWIMLGESRPDSWTPCRPRIPANCQNVTNKCRIASECRMQSLREQMHDPLLKKYKQLKVYAISQLCKIS